MFRGKVVAVAILIVGLAAIAPVVRAQEAQHPATESKQAEREALYRRYFQEHLKP